MPLAAALPDGLPIFDDERLRDEAARESRRRAPDAEHVGREPLMIDRVTHFGDAGEQYDREASASTLG